MFGEEMDRAQGVRGKRADDGECKNTKDNRNSLLLKASWGSGTALRT